MCFLASDENRDDETMNHLLISPQPFKLECSFLFPRANGSLNPQTGIDSCGYGIGIIVLYQRTIKIYEAAEAANKTQRSCKLLIILPRKSPCFVLPRRNTAMPVRFSDFSVINHMRNHSLQELRVGHIKHE